MGRALIIGAGGVASVVIHKCCQNPDVFEEICIASRTVSKCDALKAKLDGGRTKIQTAQLDADNTDMIIELINNFKPDVVVNVALPYQDLTIMDACLATGVHYVDTANYLTQLNLNINGNGHIEKNLKKQVLPHCSEVGLTQVLRAFFLHMHKSIILMKLTILIFLTQMQETMAILLQQTLTLKLIFVKSLLKGVLLRTAVGLKLNLLKLKKYMISLKSARRIYIFFTMRSWNL